ncbi:pre-mRNA-splicing regulator WTAP-like [Limulus polyphemus]|uniref:Pre-mRNA-splicing regulator WTAP-like n=1 Tax=Limulus polyphemus TaxID=6850 RepID=A0ABM1BRP5_LIMPO|nr:pre-mRNA-splicing regulator WTAP-like [Limulus polyphemus]
MTKDEILRLTKDDIIEKWMKQDKYIDSLEAKFSDNNESLELVSLRESEEKLKQQQIEATRRENILVMRLTTKEQEMQEYANQIQELKQAQIPSMAQLRTALLDPAVNFMFEKMRKEVDSTKARLEECQNELSAWKFTPDSNTGKRLMAKCRLLYQENEELGKMISSGRMAKLEGDLALQKNFSEEMKKSQSELDEFLLELDEDVEGMQSTIYYLQQQLKESKEQIAKLQQENQKLWQHTTTSANASRNLSSPNHRIEQSSLSSAYFSNGDEGKVTEEASIDKDNIAALKQSVLEERSQEVEENQESSPTKALSILQSEKISLQPSSVVTSVTESLNVFRKDTTGEEVALPTSERNSKDDTRQNHSSLAPGSSTEDEDTNQDLVMDLQKGENSSNITDQHREREVQNRVQEMAVNFSKASYRTEATSEVVTYKTSREARKRARENSPVGSMMKKDEIFVKRPRESSPLGSCNKENNEFAPFKWAREKPPLGNNILEDRDKIPVEWTQEKSPVGSSASDTNSQQTLERTEDIALTVSDAKNITSISTERTRQETLEGTSKTGKNQLIKESPQEVLSLGSSTTESYHKGSFERTQKEMSLETNSEQLVDLESKKGTQGESSVESSNTDDNDLITVNRTQTETPSATSHPEHKDKVTRNPDGSLCETGNSLSTIEVDTDTEVQVAQTLASWAAANKEPLERTEETSSSPVGNGDVNSDFSISDEEVL